MSKREWDLKVGLPGEEQELTVVVERGHRDKQQRLFRYIVAQSRDCRPEKLEIY